MARHDRVAKSCVRLEPFTETDIAQLIAWIPSREFLAQWTASVFDYPLNRAQFVQHLAEIGKEPSDRLIYKAVNPGTGHTIGHGELARIDTRNRSAALARILVGRPELRGRGIGAEIVKSLLRVAFEELSLHRVALNVFDFNQAAIRCYQKAGFQIEGMSRQACRVGDDYWDVCVMSILEHEYRGIS